MNKVNFSDCLINKYCTAQNRPYQRNQLKIRVRNVWRPPRRGRIRALVTIAINDVFEIRRIKIWDNGAMDFPMDRRSMDGELTPIFDMPNSLWIHIKDVIMEYLETGRWPARSGNNTYG